jgi:hypothetical protein
MAAGKTGSLGDVHQRRADLGRRTQARAGLLGVGTLHGRPSLYKSQKVLFNVFRGSVSDKNGPGMREPDPIVISQRYDSRCYDPKPRDRI